MEIPVTSMLSPASEISGNTVHTTVDSLESALLLRKGREEETGSKKTSRKADEKLSFLEWKSYWERLEEETRETRMRESEKSMLKNKALTREEIALWNKKQKFLISSKISLAFKFSYFALPLHDSASLACDEQ